MRDIFGPFPYNVAEVDSLAAFLGGKVGEPIIHFGMTLEAKSKSKGICNGKVGKCETELTIENTIKE